MGNDRDLKSARDAFRGMLGKARCIVPFTGAGISTECGIPDFRSPGGLWSLNQPISFQDFLDNPEMRREAWRRRFVMETAFGAARPGRGHRAVAGWVRQGRSPAVITQNIDNLHQEAGLGAGEVIELHGNTTYATCLGCGARHELAWIRGVFEAAGDPPACPWCRGLLKTATISFGQPMPQAALQRAALLARAADLFIAIGSSLVVHPAAELPALAKDEGALLVILNREATPLDDFADLVVHGEIGDVLDEYVQN